MNPERWTVKTGEVVQAAERAAREAGHPQVTNLHLLAAMLDQKEGITPALLGKLGVAPAGLASAVRRELDRSPRVQGSAARLAAAPEVPRLFESADKEAQRLTDEYLSTEHLLLAMCAPETGGSAARVLREAGIDRESLYRALEEVRGTARVTDPSPEDKYQVLK